VIPLPRSHLGRLGCAWAERCSDLAEGLTISSPTTYTANTVAYLARTGVECPSFESYSGRLLDFMVEHPELDSSAMV
jgi:hypothetical protein